MKKHYSLPRQLLHLLFLMSLLAGTVWLENGCRHNVSTNPKVVMTATLLDASNTCVTIEDGLTAANHIVNALETSEPEYYAHVRPLIKKLSAANKTASDTIVKVRNGDTAADWRGAMLAIGSGITPADLTSFGFKNSNTQAIVTAAFATLVATLNALPATYGGTK